MARCRLRAAQARWVLVAAAWLLIVVPRVSAQTPITDTTVDDILRRAEDAFARGHADDTMRAVHQITDWANHVRDMAGRGHNPAEDRAFAERMYQRALATIGQTLGPDHEYAVPALMGLPTLYLEQNAC